MPDNRDGALWRQCAAVAMGLLRWPPEVFWRATPAELYLALQGLTGGFPPGPEANPLTRAEFEALMMRFPDH